MDYYNKLKSFNGKIFDNHKIIFKDYKKIFPIKDILFINSEETFGFRLFKGEEVIFFYHKTDDHIKYYNTFSLFNFNKKCYSQTLNLHFENFEKLIYKLFDEN